MKKINLLLASIVLFSMTAFQSCSDDDDDQPNNPSGDCPDTTYDTAEECLEAAAAAGGIWTCTVVDGEWIPLCSD